MSLLEVSIQYNYICIAQGEGTHYLKAIYFIIEWKPKGPTDSSTGWQKEETFLFNNMKPPENWAQLRGWPWPVRFERTEKGGGGQKRRKIGCVIKIIITIIRVRQIPEVAFFPAGISYLVLSQLCAPAEDVMDPNTSVLGFPTNLRLPQQLQCSDCGYLRHGWWERNGRDDNFNMYILLRNPPLANIRDSVICTSAEINIPAVKLAQVIQLNSI